MQHRQNIDLVKALWSFRYRRYRYNNRSSCPSVCVAILRSFDYSYAGRFATALLLALIVGYLLAAAKAEDTSPRLRTDAPAKTAEESQSPSPSGTNAAGIEETRSAMMGDLREDRDRWRSQAEKSTSQEKHLVTETRHLVFATYLLAFGTVGLLVATACLFLATNRVGEYTRKLVDATEKLVSATDAVVKATEEHSRHTGELLEKEQKLFEQEHKRRTQMETYLAWKTVRTEIGEIPSEAKVKAIVSNWRNLGGNKRERDDLRRYMRPLEYFATAVNKGNTLDYDLVKALAGSWILHEYEKLKSFIVLAREKKGYTNYWVEIEKLGNRVAQDPAASTIEPDQEPEEPNKSV
jgi:hypothetical protein